MSNTKIETITINGVEYTRKDRVVEVGHEVIVRTYSAGVHIGTIQSRDGREIVLTDARRLYSWQGAFTLNAVAMHGIDRENSKISETIPSIILLECIEIIPIALGVDLSTTEN